MEYAANGMYRYRQLADLHKALAHPVRLQILHILAQGEACVCHITAVLQMRQPYVSQQLGVLRDAGVVVARREGTLMHYGLHDARMAGILALGESLVGAPGPGAERLDRGLSGPVEGCRCPRCHEDSTAGCLEKVGAEADR